MNWFSSGNSARLDDYQYTLNVPGEITVPELRARHRGASCRCGEAFPTRSATGCLMPEHVGANLAIRNWRAGDRYWPAHTAAERKVKEVLSDRHLSGAEKKLWPVAVSETGIVWMKGFAAPEALRPRGQKAIWIREVTGP